MHACPPASFPLPLRQMESLGQDVRELARGRNPDQAHVSILDCFVGEVLADIDVLGKFATADDIVASFNAGVVVLEHRCRLALTEAQAVKEVSDIHNLLCSGGCRIILCLSSRECRSLLHLGSPHDGCAVVHRHVSGRRTA